jgi:hypothetical protein
MNSNLIVVWTSNCLLGRGRRCVKRHSQHLAPNQIPERVPRGFPSHLPLPYENSRPMLPSSVTLCVGRTNQYEENV